MTTIRDPIHGDIELEGLPAEIINTREFQRLSEIKQLGLTYKVFPGATHTRYSHSIGACHIAGRLAERLGLDKELVQLAALLHDIGHYDFSHALEKIQKTSHEENGAMIVEKLKDTLKDRTDEVLEILTEKSVLHSIISSKVIDIDRMDYLLRDTYFSGALIGQIDLDRLLRVLVIDDEMGQLGIEEKGVASLEQFLVARLHMHQQIYQHEDCMVSEMMLRKAVMLSRDAAGSLMHGDQALLSILCKNGCEKTRELVSRLNHGRSRFYRAAFALSSLSAEIDSAKLEKSIVSYTGLDEGDVLVYHNPKWNLCDELPLFRVKLRSGEWVGLFSVSPLSRGVYQEKTVKRAIAIYCSEENVPKVRDAARKIISSI